MTFEIFKYEFRPEIVITGNDIKRYLSGENVEERKGKIISRLYSRDSKTLRRLMEANRVLAVEGGQTYVVEVRSSRGYYKLMTVNDLNVTTIEINGIHMHKVKDLDPLSDALRKVALARVASGHKVLDLCTGLGYTAIASLKRGAYVTTVEIDENVLWIAERNPWSSGLSSSRVVIILGDATEVVNELPKEFYDRIIHDPPRLSESTGDLYSLEFYLKLFKLLKRGGILYHYTGESGRLRGLNLPGKVSSRLKRAGFEILRYDRTTGGIVARKI